MSPSRVSSSGGHATICRGVGIVRHTLRQRYSVLASRWCRLWARAASDLRVRGCEGRGHGFRPLLGTGALRRSSVAYAGYPRSVPGGFGVRRLRMPIRALRAGAARDVCRRSSVAQAGHARCAPGRLRRSSVAQAGYARCAPGRLRLSSVAQAGYARCAPGRLRLSSVAQAGYARCAPGRLRLSSVAWVRVESVYI